MSHEGNKYAAKQDAYTTSLAGLFSAKQAQWLRDKAKSQGKSVSAVIRESIFDGRTIKKNNDKNR